METNEYIEFLVELIRDSDHTPVAGVNHQQGDLGFDVAMMDGSEFHIEVTKQ